MTFTIETANPERDYDSLATFLNHFEPDPISAADIHEWDQRNAENTLRRSVVRADNGRVVGYSVAVHGPWNREGEFYLWVGTDKEFRKRGHGQQLYENALAFIHSHDGTSITTDVGEAEPEGLRFAKARGFTQSKHSFQSKLELDSFDEAAFADLVVTAQEKGVRFYTLADVTDSEETRRGLYEINRRTSLQDPGSEGTFPPFERFNQDVFTASWYRPDGQWLAADGDKIVGMCAVGYFQESNSMYNLMTGVDENYRGRGIAQALKVLAIGWAKGLGADYIRTDNNSENGPMLAINRKLGYQPQPGIYTLIKRGLDT
ncbi:GNAT family N-acetyltransferase [Chloroflexi bacterium TSY]|nr:GNAT family N-acetyltransferase [Chloroflexi bacterium TSY]